MKRIVTLAAASIVLIAALTGCTGDASSKPPPSPTAAAPDTDSPQAKLAAWAERTYGSFEPVVFDGPAPIIGQVSPTTSFELPEGVNAGVLTVTTAGLPGGAEAANGAHAEAFADDGSGHPATMFDRAQSAGGLPESAAFGLDPAKPTKSITVVGANTAFTVTLSPITDLLELPGSGSHANGAVYLYSGPAHGISSPTAQIFLLQSTGAGDNLALSDGVGQPTGKLLAGPSVVTVQVPLRGPWKIKLD